MLNFAAALVLLSIAQGDVWLLEGQRQSYTLHEMSLEAPARDILWHPWVQEELSLTPAQIATLEQGTKADHAPRYQPEDLEAHARGIKSLSKAQRKRLVELLFQLAGPDAALHPRVAATMGITPQDSERLRSLAGMRVGDAAANSPERVLERHQKLLGALTPGQRQMLEARQGRHSSYGLGYSTAADLARALILHEDVAEDLGIPRTMVSARESRIRERMSKGPHEATTSLIAAIKNESLASLSTTQRNRLRQITLQTLGPRALLDGRSAERAGLTHAQYATLFREFRAIEARFEKESNRLQSPPQGGGPAQMQDYQRSMHAWHRERLKLSQNMRRAQTAVVERVVAPAQLARLSDELGRPFEGLLHHELRDYGVQFPPTGPRLLMQDWVLDELSLTREQRQLVQALRDAQRRDRGPYDPSQAERDIDRIHETLSQRQRERLFQVQIQTLGLQAILQPKLASRLGVTPEGYFDILDALGDQQQRYEVRQPGDTRSEGQRARDSWERAESELAAQTTRLRRVLTQDQWRRWDALRGPLSSFSIRSSLNKEMSALLWHPSVQREVGLSQGMAERLRAAALRRSADPREAMRLQEKASEQALGSLSASARMRLRSIAMQVKGARSIGFGEVARAVGLSYESAQRIDRDLSWIETDLRLHLPNPRRRLDDRPRQLSQEEIRRLYAEAEKKIDAVLARHLTPAQLQTFRKMMGPRFAHLDELVPMRQGVIVFG